jgi:ribosomal-protein-alanine N-acetyltransferase
MRELPPPTELPHELRTPRTLLRHFTDADRAPFAALNADPEVMEFLEPPQTRAESDATVGRIVAHTVKYGFTFWALELPGVTTFAGFVGLIVPRYQAHFTPCVEIGWRLAKPHWGAGYATEAARAALAFGFDELHQDEIVATCSPGNLRSQRVLAKLGLRTDPADDFDHPLAPADDPNRRQRLYRLRRPGPAR